MNDLVKQLTSEWTGNDLAAYISTASACVTYFLCTSQRSISLVTGVMLCRSVTFPSEGGVTPSNLNDWEDEDPDTRCNFSHNCFFWAADLYRRFWVALETARRVSCYTEPPEWRKTQREETMGFLV